MQAILTSSFNHNQFGILRTLVDENGNPWFVAREIAEALGYKNINRDIQRHCKGGTETVLPSEGGNQRTKIIPESDLYRLILRSKLPQAEAFQDWVTEEILPSIRKHGVYRKDKEPEPELLTEKSFIEHDGCFWLATDIIAKELEHIGIKDGADEVQLGFEGDLDDMLKNYITSIDGRKYVKEYGVNYLLLSIALETLEDVDKNQIYGLCARIESILGSKTLPMSVSLL